MPLDVRGAMPAEVELTIQANTQSSVMVIRADLPSGMIRETCNIRLSGEAIQNATRRLRQELEKIVFYPNGRNSSGPFPFANTETVAIDLVAAREAYVPLADAGQQVWDMLFNVPGGDNRLNRFAADLRTLPHGSRIRVVLDSHEFIVPWALLYDAPGPISGATLDWSGFWGYRYMLKVLPPGRYPAPAIGDVPFSILLLLNDDQNLTPFTTTQERFVKEGLIGAHVEVAWGSTNVENVLRAPPVASLIYCYCHGVHESGAAPSSKRDVVSLASESALLFGGGQRLRLADLRRLPVGPLTSRPLVFLNACEGGALDAFYYDGFMPFLIEQHGARGFIGAEVKAPQLLAHDIALDFLHNFAAGAPVGEILWRLRRHYLEHYNNILAFNYSLYCPGETRLAQPLLINSEALSSSMRH